MARPGAINLQGAGNGIDRGLAAGQGGPIDPRLGKSPRQELVNSRDASRWHLPFAICGPAPILPVWHRTPRRANPSNLPSTTNVLPHAGPKFCPNGPWSRKQRPQQAGLAFPWRAIPAMPVPPWSRVPSKPGARSRVHPIPPLDQGIPGIHRPQQSRIHVQPTQ